MNLIVHINGWPGSGKLTIARLLAEQLDARLIDNHTLINPAECLFARDDPHYQPMRKAVRTLAFDYALRLPLHVPIVLTDALADITSDQEIFDSCRGLADRRAARLVSVVLDCNVEENFRRSISPGRADLFKLTDTGILKHLRASYQLLRPAGIERFELDVSNLSANEAAMAVFEHCMQAPCSLKTKGE